MKLIILLISIFSITALAGNGGGTMAPEKSVSISSISKQNTGILYYQGETKNDIYFKFGQAQGSKWDIEQFKVNKKTELLNEVILDALEKSKSTNDWSRVDINQNLRTK